MSVAAFDLMHPNGLSEISPWQLDFRQIEPGRMRTNVRLRRGDLVSLMELRMSHGVHQVGAAPAGTVNFGIPLTQTMFHWHGRELTSASMCCFGNGDEFDADCKGRFDAITISVPEHVLDQIAAQCGLIVNDRIRGPSAIADDTGGAQLQHLAMRAGSYLKEIEARFQEVDQEDLIIGLLLAANDQNASERKNERNRARVLDRALQMMAHNVDENVPISKVCTEVGASWSTLDRAFKERNGIGPKAYYHRLRLGRLKADLLSKAPEVQIADLANQYGFWHMGQLAKDFRALFGVLPSELSRR